MLRVPAAPPWGDGRLTQGRLEAGWREGRGREEPRALSFDFLPCGEGERRGK